MESGRVAGRRAAGRCAPPRMRVLRRRKMLDIPRAKSRIGPSAHPYFVAISRAMKWSRIRGEVRLSPASYSRLDPMFDIIMTSSNRLRLPDM